MPECFGIFSGVTGFARPMSRRQVTKRRELLLPSLIPDRHQADGIFDPSVRPAPATPIKGGGEESPRYWIHQKTRYLAPKEARQTTEVAGPELIGANHLLARLVFQQIRPNSHSGLIGGQSCSSDEPQRGRVPASAPDVRSPLRGRVVVPAEVPVPRPVETLFTQLARRRLRSRATKEKR
jgi:hypothetical protein